MSDTDSEDKLMKLVAKIVAGIIAKDEDFSPEDIDHELNLIEHYGIDSLTFISKAMALEEYFEVEINDGQLEKLTNVNSISNFIIEKSPDNILSEIKSDTDVNKALIDIDPNENNTSKQIRHIITSSFISGLQSDLHLNINSIYMLLNKLLRNSKVEHVSSIPKLNNAKLESVYIVFLTKKQLYYICLSENKISVREVYLQQLSIESEYNFNSKGAIVKVDIVCDVKDVDEKGLPKKYSYSIPENFVDVTIKLIGKIHEYKGENNGK